LTSFYGQQRPKEGHRGASAEGGVGIIQGLSLVEKRSHGAEKKKRAIGGTKILWKKDKWSGLSKFKKKGGDNNKKE